MYSKRFPSLSTIVRICDSNGRTHLNRSRLESQTNTTTLAQASSTNQEESRGSHRMFYLGTRKQSKDDRSADPPGVKGDTETNNSSSIGPMQTNISLFGSKNELCNEYSKAIQDLNLLQSNTQVVALAKYKRPEDILPLFKRQLNLATINVGDLDKLNIIHVSGTKGKGSTCAYLESILMAAGLKTGFYNSPHLIKVTERIRINGKPIDEEKFSKYFRPIYDCLRCATAKEDVTMPTYFSFLTILAFHIFLEEKVDCAIMEVGIGGEYDPTNIVQHPVACGISTLDFDHTNILGKTIESIAWSKAGIAKEGVPLITIDQEHNGALEVIRQRSVEKHCPLYICKPLKKEGLQLGIRGQAQYMNAALACQLAKHFLVNVCGLKLGSRHESVEENQTLETELSEMPTFFREGLENCYWPGRCQVVKTQKLTFFLDGAHTRKSMENCLGWFESASSESATKILMVNVIGERDRCELLRPLVRYDKFEQVIFSTNRIISSINDKNMDNVRSNASSWDNLVKECGLEYTSTVIMPSTSDSFRHIGRLSKLNHNKEYHILVTGSLHLVGAVLETMSTDPLMIDLDAR